MHHNGMKQRLLPFGSSIAELSANEIQQGNRTQGIDWVELHLSNSFNHNRCPIGVIPVLKV